MSTTARKPVTGFQFITSINSIDRDDETRRKVRSHARRQKLPTQPSKQVATKNGSQKERTSKFRVGTRTSSNNTRKQSPTNSTSPKDGYSTTSSSGSPSEKKKPEVKNGWQTEMITKELAFTVAPELASFPILPIRTTPLTENLFKWMICICLSPQEKFVQQWFNRCGAPSYFNTYHSSFLALSHSMNTRGSWFDFITVDPAMTHGFMGLVAAMHNALAVWDDTMTVDFHRYECLSHINKRLNQEGRDETNVSDGVIVSVSLLVQIEAFIGSLYSARAHMMGLKKMVELRSGLIKGFAHSPLLQRALAWADFAHATASQTPLSFPYLTNLASSLGIQDRFLSRSIIISTAPSSHTEALTVGSREMIEILELLYSTTQAVNTFEFDKLEDLQAERGQMSDSIYLIEYKLCTLEETIRCRERSRLALEATPQTARPFAKTGAQGGYDSPSDLSDALVFASHLFLHMALRAQPPQAKAHKLPLEALLMSLYEVIERLDLVPEPMAAPSSQSPELRLPPTPSSGSWHSAGQEYTPPPTASPEEYGTGARDDKDHLYEDLLLWILFVAACVQVQPSSVWCNFAGVRDYRTFFLGALRKYCIHRGLLSRVKLHQALSSVIHLDSFSDCQFEIVWASIGYDSGL